MPRPTRPKRKPRRRKQRIPSAAVRRIKTPRIPRAVELFYLLVLGKVAKAFAEGVKKRLYSKLHKFAAPEPETKTDASEEEPGDGDVAETMATLRQEIPASLESGELPKGSHTAAKRVVKHSQDEFERLGITLIDTEPNFEKLIDTWRKQSVDRITSVEENQLTKIRKILANGEGLRVDALTKELEWQLDDVTESQCALIARDQVLTLNALITKERQEACGIAEFVWTTSGDERVRESHAEIDGQTFRWDDPPIVDDEPAIPGEPIQCRCVPYPLLRELGDAGAPQGDDDE